MKTRIMLLAAASISGALMAISVRAGEPPVGTGFTYQGQLKESGLPVNGQVDLEFRLFNDPNGSVQIGTTWIYNGVEAVNGLFSVYLDFGPSSFNGLSRWIEIMVRNPAGSENLTTLNPRQEITATPYAVRALKANSALALDAPDGSPTNAVFVNNAGNVGIGTSNPETHLHVAGGTDVALAGGGFIQSGTAGANIAIDDNEIMARSNGGPSGLFLNHEGGNVLIAGASASGSVGIGTSNPLAGVHIAREPFNVGGTLALAGSTHTYMSFFPQGGSRKAWLGFGGAGSNRFAVMNESGADITFWTNGGEQVWIDSGGIGVANMPYIGDWHNVQWADHGRVGYDDSTRKHKENVKPLVDDFERLLESQAVTYTRPGRPDRWEIGYIAEEMNDLGLTKLVQFDTNGEVSGFNYEKSLIYLVEIAKAQRTQLTEQAARLAAYDEALRAITNRLDMVEQVAPRQ